MKDVVVGVSASSGSPEALRCAAEEAQWRHAGLVAVQAWRPPRPPASPGGHPPGVTLDTDAAFAEAAAALRAQVRKVLGPAGSARCRLVQGSPARVLLDESAEACLLVVDGPRTKVPPRSPLLAHRLVNNAKCPVLVMPASQSGGNGPALKRGSKRLAAGAAQADATAGRPGVGF